MSRVRQMAMSWIMIVSVGWLTSATWGAGFDQDRDPDLVLAVNFGDDHGQVTWYENVGGTVVIRDIIPFAGSTFDAVIFCNVDGDDFPDLLVGGSNGMSWFEARTPDTVTLVQEWPLTGANYHDIQVLGGNIYAARQGAFEKLVVEGDDSASWVALWSNGSIDYRTMAGGDFDYDGNVEVLIGWNWTWDMADGQWDLFEDTGSAFNWTRTFSFAPGGNQFASGDFDGDGFLDVFTSNARDNQIDWFEATGADNELAWRRTVVYRKAVHLLLTDVDGDGKDELMTSEVGNGEASRLLASGGDNVIGTETVLNSYHYSGCLAAGDWDKNGVTDLFFGSKPETYGVIRGELGGSFVALNATFHVVDAAFYPGTNEPASQNMAFDVPAAGSITTDGDLSDWTASTDWSDPYIWWSGTSLISTTRAKFAWNDAEDLLYVAIQTNESSVRPGGHAVIGLSKAIGGNPLTGNGATQLCFDIQGSSVWIRNEINETNQTGDLTTGVQAGYSVSNGVYTYEIAIPLWSDWKQTIPANRQALSVGDTVFLYSCMESAFGTGNGTNLTWLGNPKFYMGAFDKASALKLTSGPRMPGDANGDGVVTFEDFSILQNQYGQSVTPNTGADFTGDGEVTFQDFAILQNNYGRTAGDTPAGVMAAAAIPCGPLGLALSALVGLSLLFLRNQE